MAKIPGLDTVGLGGCPDLKQKVEVPEYVIARGHEIQSEWTQLGMSFVPFCSQCREPLTWNSPAEGDLLFECPLCGRQWIMNNDWIIKVHERNLRRRAHR